MKKIFKFLIYFFYSKIILFSIFVLRLKKTYILYPDHFGFGDFVQFCNLMRYKIKKNKIFCYSILQYEIANFFFEKKNIKTSLVLMPKFMNESHIGYNFLLKSKIFESTKYPVLKLADGIRVPSHDFFIRTRESIQYTISRINPNIVSIDLLKLFQKPTLLLFIKNFSKKKNNHINFQVRQTRNLDKIIRLINFINKKNVNTLIIGKNNEHFIQYISKVISNKNWKNVYLFNKLSKNYSIVDQAYVALHALGYIGSSSGAGIFCTILKKKLVIIDAPYHYIDKYWDNYTFLYKKLYNKINKNFKKFIWKKHYNPVTYKIVETNYKEIKEAVQKQLLCIDNKKLH
jgi:hypothetical protein